MNDEWDLGNVIFWTVRYWLVMGVLGVFEKVLTGF